MHHHNLESNGGGEFASFANGDINGNIDTHKKHRKVYENGLDHFNIKADLPLHTGQAQHLLAAKNSIKRLNNSFPLLWNATARNERRKKRKRKLDEAPAIDPVDNEQQNFILLDVFDADTDVDADTEIQKEQETTLNTQTYQICISDNNNANFEQLEYNIELEPEIILPIRKSYKLQNSAKSTKQPLSFTYNIQEQQQHNRSVNERPLLNRNFTLSTHSNNGNALKRKKIPDFIELLNCTQIDSENSETESEEDDIYAELELASALNKTELLVSKQRGHKSQMGINLLSKLRELFGLKKKTTAEQRQKRRLEEQAEATAPPIKYRRVENNFPKFVASTAENGTSHMLNSTCHTKTYQIPKLTLCDSLNMSDRRPKFHKSPFVEPKTTRKIIKNNSYADVEFSDDDDNLDISRAAVSFKRPADINKIQPRYSKDVEAGSVNTNLVFSSRSYEDLLRQSISNASANRCIEKGHVLGTRLTNSQQQLPDTASYKAANNAAKTMFPLSRSNSVNRRSMLHQQKQNEDHKRYMQLLQRVEPFYGIEKPRAKDFSLLEQLTVQNGLSGTRSKKSKDSKPAITINLTDDEDEDDDVEFSGVLASSSMANIKQQTTNIRMNKERDDADNERSDIIDLSAENIPSDIRTSKQNNSYGNMQSTLRPLIPRVNTLFERIRNSPVSADNWIDELKSKFLQQKKSRDRELREMEALTSTLVEERCAGVRELQQQLKNFQIVDPEYIVLDDFPEPEEEKEPRLVPLTAEHHAVIKNALQGHGNEVLSSKFNLNVTRRDLQTLQGLSWLNDEIINFYMNLLTERSEKKAKSHGLPTVYAMNTFFMPRLVQNGHSGVKRWTRKVDIFSKDLIPVPVHVGGVHWCMAIINLKAKSIKYYDSMCTPNPVVLQALESYLKAESMDKRKESFDTKDFVIESVANVPRQMNGSDCGVFSCMFAEFITRNAPITFSQQHMEYFRLKMMYEILQGELLQ